MTMERDRHNKGRSRLAGILATLLFHLVVLAALLWVAMDYVPGQERDRRWPPVKDDEILYGGEYVVLGEPMASVENTPESEPESGVDDTPETRPEGSDSRDEGEQLSQTPELVTQASESPVKVKKKEEKPKPKGPDKAELEKQQRVKRRQEASRRINDRVSFGHGTGKKEGSPGQANGNADHGALSGAPGTDLAGRTLASWTKPAGNATGTIVVEVKVDRKGRVTHARYVNGSGAIAGSMAARRSCEQAALKSAFSVSDNAPASQTGRITYRFE